MILAMSLGAEIEIVSLKSIFFPFESSVVTYRRTSASRTSLI
jgi:hypothetical protein